MFNSGFFNTERNRLIGVFLCLIDNRTGTNVEGTRNFLIFIRLSFGLKDTSVADVFPKTERRQRLLGYICHIKG